MTLGDRLAPEGCMGAAGQEVMCLGSVPVAVVVVVVRGCRRALMRPVERAVKAVSVVVAVVVLTREGQAATVAVAVAVAWC